MKAECIFKGCLHSSKYRGKNAGEWVFANMAIEQGGEAGTAPCLYIGDWTSTNNAPVLRISHDTLCYIYAHCKGSNQKYKDWMFYFCQSSISSVGHTFPPNIWQFVITRPRPAFGRLDLGGSSGRYGSYGYIYHASLSKSLPNRCSPKVLPTVCHKGAVLNRYPYG